MIINIPPAPFKGGDAMVSIHEKLLGQLVLFYELLNGVLECSIL